MSGKRMIALLIGSLTPDSTVVIGRGTGPRKFYWPGVMPFKRPTTEEADGVDRRLLGRLRPVGHQC